MSSVALFQGDKEESKGVCQRSTRTLRPSLGHGIVRKRSCLRSIRSDRLNYFAPRRPVFEIDLSSNARETVLHPVLVAVLLGRREISRVYWVIERDLLGFFAPIVSRTRLGLGFGDPLGFFETPRVLVPSGETLH